MAKKKKIRRNQTSALEEKVLRRPKTIVLTLGDPGGLGPEVIVKALTDHSADQSKLPISKTFRLLIIGHEHVLQQTAENYQLSFNPKKIQSIEELNTQSTPGIYLLSPKKNNDFITGQVNARNGEAAWEYLQTALDLILRHQVDAVVTGPVSKEAINQAGYPFIGHTELFAKKTNTRKVVMMFTTNDFKVSLATTHLAYKKVPLHLSTHRILETIVLTHNWLKEYFGLAAPRIGVCGLNPHAGEAGWLGNEEKNIIAPAIEQAKKQEIICLGPYPADSIFKQAREGEFDAVVAMYHDQGLIPIKTFGFHQAVNITLGLPVIRTSVAHGTGFDIAGQGIARADSMRRAIDLAAQMCLKKQQLF